MRPSCATKAQLAIIPFTSVGAEVEMLKKSKAKFTTFVRKIFFINTKPDRKFLILLPIHRKPNLLKYALASVFNQYEKDFEIHIISDGSPEETTQTILNLVRRHRTITYHFFSKGYGNGEVYRDPIIRSSHADLVCQIADDDIWFPNHLQEIEKLLRDYDFGNTIQTEAAPVRRLMPLIADIADHQIASRMINERFNIFGPTASGYRKEAYLKLEEGWSPAPPNVWSDLHMWRKFLRHDAIRCGSRLSFTNLHIALPHHRDMTMEEREPINADWWEMVSKPASMNRLMQSLAQPTHRSKDGWLEFERGS
jgi:glycosyltransferase involved in cell wall biosynthesis